MDEDDQIQVIAAKDYLVDHRPTAKMPASYPISDIQVSTLRSYLGTLGFELELVAKDEHGERIPIELGFPILSTPPRPGV